MLGAAVFAAPAVAQDGPAWERAPYAVRVSLAADAGALPAGAERALAGSLWNTYGEAWDLSFGPPPAALSRFDAAGLRRLSADDFPPPAAPPATDDDGNPVPPADPPPDRWFVATVAADGAGGLAVAAREWDADRRVLGRTATAAAGTGPAAVRAAAGLIRDLFHPTYRIEPPADAVPGGSDVLVTARAAALPARDPAADPLAAGRLLSVYLRLYDRDGGLREVRETPLTFVRLAGEPDPPTRPGRCGGRSSARSAGASPGPAAARRPSPAPSPSRCRPPRCGWSPAAASGRWWVTACWWRTGGRWHRR